MTYSSVGVSSLSNLHLLPVYCLPAALRGIQRGPNKLRPRSVLPIDDGLPESFDKTCARLARQKVQVLAAVKRMLVPRRKTTNDDNAELT